MRDVPTHVGRESQHEHYPPQYQQRSHPELVSSDAESWRQDVCARSEQNVQSRNFRYGSKRRMRCRQRVERFAELEGNLWANTRGERRNHGEHNHAKIKNHNYRLAPSVFPEAPLARQQRAAQKPQPHDNLKKQNHIGVSRCHESSPSLVLDWPAASSSQENSPRSETRPDVQ